jgi:hypothetical protein
LGDASQLQEGPTTDLFTVHVLSISECRGPKKLLFCQYCAKQFWHNFGII